MTSQLNVAEDSRAEEQQLAPYAMLKRLTLEQICLLSSGLAHAGYKSIWQAERTVNAHLISLCGTSNLCDINLEHLRQSVPELAELDDAIDCAKRMVGFVQIYILVGSQIERLDRFELAKRIEREEEEIINAKSRVPSIIPPLSKLETAIKALRGESLAFPNMLPPYEKPVPTSKHSRIENTHAKRPGRAKAYSENREKVLSAAIHVMVENLADDGSMWRNNKPVGARVAAYLDEHAYFLFGTENAPMKVEPMAKLINKALSKPETVDKKQITAS